jgi:crotonobetainyl-CoA:carnitine CoA-transferase CaiB-like acyl-CoA transferase
VSTRSDTAPLAGVRVLDISKYIAGPYCGQLLAYLGAEVIKIEDPVKGDPMRSLSKYDQGGYSAHFAAGNASKQSVGIDLRTDAGRALLIDMVKKSDVLIENFRPGTMEKMGLPLSTLVEANPALIVVSITGFGQSGPWRDWAAYDLVAQAAGGCMSLTGRPGEKPVKIGVPVGDVGASIYAALAVCAALYRRTHSRAGDVIDVAMMDVQLSLLNYNAHYYWISGESPAPEGDGHPNITPYQSYATRTEPIVVAVYGDRFWPPFCHAIERPDLIDHPDFATNTARMGHRNALEALLSDHFLTRDRNYWLSRLTAEGVPSAPLNSVGEAVDSPQAAARNMVRHARSGNGESLKVMGSPLKFSRYDHAPKAPPLLGEHTREVLSRLLGLDGATIGNLQKEGIVA